MISFKTSAENREEVSEIRDHMIENYSCSDFMPIEIQDSGDDIVINVKDKKMAALLKLYSASSLNKI